MITFLLVGIFLSSSTVSSRNLQPIHSRKLTDTNPANIVGGDLARNGEFPFYMRVVEKILPAVTTCGATLIGPYFALTAAHCTMSIETHVLQAGSVDVIDTRGLNASVDIADVKGFYAIEEFHLHPKFLGVVDLTRGYDMILVCLKSKVEFNNYIKPISIPNVDEDFVNRPVIIVGSGQNEVSSNKPSKHLKMMNSRIIPIEKCRESYPKIRTQIDEDLHYCTESHHSSIVCYGDAGGALVYRNETSTYFVGIVSFGGPCKPMGKPEVYTKIQLYIGTFDDIMTDYTKRKNQKIFL